MAKRRKKRRGEDVVTLWGEIVEEGDTHLRFKVLPTLEARDVGLAAGPHWFARRWLFGRGHVDGLDYIRVRYELASLVAQESI